MAVVLIASTEDPASENIKKSLLEQSNWIEKEQFQDSPIFQHLKMKDVLIVTIQDRKIFHENLDKEIENELGIKPKQAIFLSRHTSKMGQPSLTVHPLGNYGKAEFGGKARTLVRSSPRLMTELLRLIKKNVKQTNLDYKVCYEVTHHGPYLDIPTMFVEVGSTEKEWNQTEPATVIAKSLLKLLQSYHYEQDMSNDIPVLIGIGGGHYAPRFTDVILERNAAFGHMIPAYHIEAGNIDYKMIEKAIEATPNVKGIYLHKKALKKSQITEYRQFFQERGIPVVSSKELPAL